MSSRNRTIFRITFDDAVEVLKHLKVEENDDNSETRRVGTMLAKREFSDNEQQGYRERYGRDKRQKTYISSGQGPKTISKCRSCNEPKHWYREPECIYNVMKARMDGEEVPFDTRQKLAPTTRHLFKDEHGNFQNKILASKLTNSIRDSNGNLHMNNGSSGKANNSYLW